jgi:hypothetical protein
MPKNEQLPRGLPIVRPPGHSKLIAAKFLLDSLDASTPLMPLPGEEIAAQIGWRFFQAGRFRANEPPKKGEHLWQSRFQEPQEFTCEVGVRHGRDMLTTTRIRSNDAIRNCREARGLEDVKEGGTAHIPVGLASHIIESLLEKCERRREDERRDGEHG